MIWPCVLLAQLLMRYSPIGWRPPPGWTPGRWVVCLMVLACIYVLASIWVTSVKFIAYTTSWSTLSPVYGYTEHTPPDGEISSYNTLRFDGLIHGSYKNCLTVITSNEGLYMTPMWLFHWGHTPLLLPWDQMNITTTTYWFGSQATVQLPAAKSRLDEDLSFIVTLSSTQVEVVQQYIHTTTNSDDGMLGVGIAKLI